MDGTATFLARAGPVLAVAGGIVGIAVGSPETAALWSLVGFFLGKSLVSVARTVTGGPAS